MLVFWDANLFIYLMEENPEYADRVQDIFAAHVARGDQLCTSHLAVGEAMTGPQKVGDTARAESFVDFMLASNIRILPFDLDAARRFSQIRAIYRLSTPDAIHLACAAAEGVDVFLTNDTQLPKLTIPGIARIAHLNSDIFASLLP